MTSATATKFRARDHQPPAVQGVYVLPPRQGRHSLLGIESAFASLRSQKSQFSFEIYGHDGLISYFVRARNYPALTGILAACYPQAELDTPQEYRGRKETTAQDWLHVRPDENLYALPLHLKHAPYLPLRFYTDQSLARGETDPLASVLGYLSAASMDGRRIGARLLVHPAPGRWSQKWQRQLQRRKDRQDLNVTTTHTQHNITTTTHRDNTDPLPGVSPTAMLGLAGAAGIGYYAYKLYEDGMILPLVGLALGATALAGLGYLAYRKFLVQDEVRTYFDEEMAAAKLGAQGFNVELQLLTAMPKRLGKNPARDALEGLAAVYSQFDNQAGNAWEPGKVRAINAPPARPANRRNSPPLLLGPPPLNKRRMAATILSPRELGTIWHLPIGEEEAALMLRAGSRQLRTYLQGLDHGALIGYAVGSDAPVKISSAVLRRHMLLLGKSGMGKSTLAVHIIAGKLHDMARGLDNDAIVVIDPHRDLVRDILHLVPPELAHKVRLIDMGNRERVPAINLLDPKLHKNRDRCVSVVIESLRHLSDNAWGPRMHSIMDCCLKTIYEYNDHELTTREEMLTMLDILPLLAFETPQGGNGRRPTGPAPLSEFQKRVLQRVADPDLLSRFDLYSRWSEQLRNDAFAPVETRMGGFASDHDPRAIMGQWETTIDISKVISEGQILLVNTARGTVGPYVSSLMGSTIVSLIEAALMEQDQLEREQRRNCLLVADEFQSVTGAPWEQILAEIRKFGGMALLITQGLTRLDTDDRRLKAGVLANCGGLVCYQMSGEDAIAVVEQMGRDYNLTETDLVDLNPFSAYLKLTVEDTAIPPFSIRTRPPEPGNAAALSTIAAEMIHYTRDRETALQEIAQRMRSNSGNAATFNIGDPKPASDVKVSQEALDQSALPAEMVKKVIANIDDPVMKELLEEHAKGKASSIIKRRTEEIRRHYEDTVIPQRVEQARNEAQAQTPAPRRKRSPAPARTRSRDGHGHARRPHRPRPAASA